ncbi:MAG: tRNA(Met) cytidine acetate ligase [Catonella sp.]|uniref:tRNA(Met) cytidine acetate ligase n=1 Tax=Catonella sp. TaxID=2382125 RepID=UPI003FA0DF20
MINNEKVAAIIAEYNPFHNGHAYHIKETKRLTNAKYIIILMSGNFVQRGEPSIIDKYRRAASALLSGADAVFELPVTVSTGSAEIFADGSVALAEKLGIIDYLSFGAENDNITDLIECSKLLIQKNHNKDIAKIMSSGTAFPESRDIYLRKNGYVKEADLLKTSNNILAISYLNKLNLLNSNIVPIAIKRAEVLHDSEIIDDKNLTIASAKAIRKDLHDSLTKNSLKYMPDSTITRLNPNGFYIKNNDFSDILFYKLGEIIYKNNKKDAIRILSNYSDVTTDLACRIYNLFGKSSSYDEFAASLWSKNYTYARIDRVLFHIIGGITRELIENNRAYGFCPYIRPLAIKNESIDILNSIGKLSKANDDIKLIARIGDAKKLENKAAIETFRITSFMTALYNQISFNKYNLKCHDEVSESFILRQKF